ncbi:OB-fold domain-containing protein [bacterium]|nr:OB-fold domain-containing protein [bacterium]
MTNQGKASWPLPDVANVDKPFWDAVQDEKFLLQKCRECGRLQFLPRPVCVECFSMDLDWQESQGTGRIYSFTHVFAPVRPGPRKQVSETGVPIIFAAIDLDEGVRAMSELVDCKPGEVRTGDRVQVCFREATDTDFKLPKFRLVE